MADGIRQKFERFTKGLKEAVGQSEEQGDLPEQEISTPRDVSSSSGKAKRQDPDPAPSYELAQEDLKPLVQSTANMILSRYQLEPLNDQEANELAGAYRPLLSKYFGTALDRYGPEIAALGVSVKIFGPRVMEYRDRQEQEAGSSEPEPIEPEIPEQQREIREPEIPDHVRA